jgi:hypothetical protein
VSDEPRVWCRGTSAAVPDIHTVEHGSRFAASRVNDRRLPDELP